MSGPHGYPYSSAPMHADTTQLGLATRLRYDPAVPYPLRGELMAISHSSDIIGKFSKIPNQYRDLTCTYDPKAQVVIDRALAYKK